jgi:hypothetical protein
MLMYIHYRTNKVFHVEHFSTFMSSGLSLLFGHGGLGAFFVSADEAEFL